MENKIIAVEKFSDPYLKFTRGFNQLEVREEDQTILVPEKIIRCIYNDQFFTLSGSKPKTTGI